MCIVNGPFEISLYIWFILRIDLTNWLVCVGVINLL